MKKEKSCGTIIINNEQVLLIKQLDQTWGFPKGHMNKNETEEGTAIRETKEETGLDVKIICQKKYKTTYLINDNTIKDVIFFIAKPITNIQKKQEDEIEEIKWVDIMKAESLITYEDTKQIYREVLKNNDIFNF